MSDESFLARWSRLKREQAAAPARTDAAPPPATDLASLPPVESIGPGTDITAYLVAGVPLELTRAALRSAWRTDPVIREFVEMADNQWDFNTPDAIPGFGALGAVEESNALLGRAAAGAAENTATLLASLQQGRGQPESRVRPAVALEDSRVVDPVWQAGATPPASVDPLDRPTHDPEPDTPPPGRRLHGSALPK